MATANDVLSLYVRLRDEIERRDEIHKAEMKPLKDKLEMLNTQLLGYLNESGVDNIAIKGVATAYKKTVVSVSVADWPTTLKWIQDNEMWDALDAGINKTFTKAYVEKNQAAPPGVKYSTAIDVGVRRANGTAKG